MKRPHPDAERITEEARRRNGHGYGVIGMRADTVEIKPVFWFWRNRVPKGKLTIFDGDPDIGKSAVTMDIAARKSAGRAFPDGAACEPGNVIIANVEDGAGDTIVPRLKAAGADLGRVHIISGIPDANGGTRLLELPMDIALLEEYVHECEAELLILDPIMTMLGGDANKDQDARKALTPVRDMAERTGAAVIAVRHLNKSVGLKAIQRGGGNMGLIGVARAGSFFAKDPEDDRRRVMAPHKSNLAEKPPSLRYKIVSSPVHNTARVEWMGVSEYDADGLAADDTTPHERSQLDEAREFLRAELEAGPMWAKQVYKDARDAGIAERTLRRAKDVLRVVSEKIGTEGWSWRLPEQDKPPHDSNEGGHVPDEGGHEGGHAYTDGHLGHLGHLGRLPLSKGNGARNTSDKPEGGQGGQGGQGWEGGQDREGDQGDQDDQHDHGGRDDHDHDHLPPDPPVWFNDPPDWFKAQAAKVKRDGSLEWHVTPLAKSTSHALHGTVKHHKEVRPFVREYLERLGAGG